MYGAIVTKGRYGRQRVLPLADVAVFGLGDRGDAPFGVQINHRRKSFQVGASALCRRASGGVLCQHRFYAPRRFFF